MALHATVYCNCFEQDRLRTPPPLGCKVTLDGDGSLHSGSDDLEVQMAFDRWCHDEACEHENGWLVLHRIGNIDLVRILRTELQRWPHKFPLILERVIYNGVHCCDYLTAAEVPQLQPEVDALADVVGSTADTELFLREFEQQMRELVSAALQVGKPIVF